MKKTLAAALLSAVAATGLVVHGAASGTEPTGAACDATDAAIYTPPPQLGPGPGTVLACAPSALPEIGTDIPFRSWKLQFQSTDVHGQAVAVSGLAAVPEAAWPGPGPRPVIAFNPGTTGLGSRCAYSKQMSGANVDAYETEQLAAALEAGYAVVSSDGVGYLDGQLHTYMVGQNAGRALLDVTKAAATLPDAGIDPKAPVGLWGYSEGGQASAWAAQLAATYAPELSVSGLAAGGVPGDLEVVANHLNGSDFAGFAGAALVGFHAGFPDMPFDELLNDNGRAAVTKLKDSCLISTVFGFRGARVEDFTTDGLTVDELYALPGPDGVTWGELSGRQTVGKDIGPAGSGAQYQIGFPTFQYRGASEQIIPIETEEATMRAYCDAGVTTRWKGDVQGDHLAAAANAIPDVLAFFADRFAGTPEAGTCGTR